MFSDHDNNKIGRNGRSAMGLMLALLLCTAPAAGCDDDDNSNPPDEAGSVEVVYDGNTVTVELGDLTPVTLDDGEEYARLSDIIEAAALGVELDSLEFDFEGSDGFRSSTQSTCVDHIPAPGEWLRQGYVHLTTRDMEWDEAADMPGCTRVDDMARLHAGDAGVAGPTVDVTYGTTTVTVELSGLEAVTFREADHVRITDVMAAADLGTATEDLVFDFVASDGFRSSDSGSCTDTIPMPGAQIADGYINLETRDLDWEDAAAMPGCVHLDDLAEIEASDPA